MNSSHFLEPTQLSLSKRIQSEAVEWNNEDRNIHAKLVYNIAVIFIKTPALFIDIILNALVGTAKIFLRLAVLSPINFTLKKLNKEEIQSDWTAKQGLFHFGCSGLYLIDIFVQPFNNLCWGPSVYVNSYMLTFSHIYVNPNTQNRHGNHSLMHAIQKGNDCAVKRLIKAGANIDMPNKQGYTPRFMMKYGYLPSKEKSKTRGEFNQPVKLTAYDKEYKQLKILGHVASIPDQFDIQGNPFNFESMPKTQLFPNQTNKNIDTFAKSHKDSISNFTLKTINQSLSQLTGKNEVEDEELAKQYLSGQPIILRSGYSGYIGHFSTIVIWNDFFIVCDRNKSALQKIYQIKDTKNIKKIIGDIKNLRTDTKENYHRYFSKLSKNKVIESKSSILSNFSLPRQTTGNCSYANLEDAIYTIWQLADIQNSLKITNITELENHQQIEVETKLRETKSNFHRFRIFQTEKHYKKLEKNFPNSKLSKEAIYYIQKSVNEDYAEVIKGSEIFR